MPRRVDRPLARGARPRAPRLVAVLAHVRDPGNAGTVIRTADAAGADAVVLTDASVDVAQPQVRPRHRRQPVPPAGHDRGAAWPRPSPALRAAGLRVLAADGAGEHDLDDLQDAAESGEGPLAGPTAWVFGNEAWGLPEEDRALADAVVRVPIHGRAESLNLATAATVCLYASARAHRRRWLSRAPGPYNAGNPLSARARRGSCTATPTSRAARL